MMCRPLACTRAPTCTTMFIYPSHPSVEECCPLGWAAVTPCSPACLSSHGFCFRAHVTVEENHRHKACQQCGRAEAGGQGGLGLLKNLLAKLQSRVCAVTENIKSHGYKTSPKSKTTGNLLAVDLHTLHSCRTQMHPAGSQGKCGLRADLDTGAQVVSRGGSGSGERLSIQLVGTGGGVMNIRPHTSLSTKALFQCCLFIQT